VIMLLQCGVTCFTIICTGHTHLQYLIGHTQVQWEGLEINCGALMCIYYSNYTCLFPPPTPPTHLLIYIHLQIDNISDIYAQTLPESPPTRALFNVLRVKVDREVQFKDMLLSSWAHWTPFSLPPQQHRDIRWLTANSP